MALAPTTRQARLDAILDAAERLIRSGGGTQFSMRALAAEAGVSPATPFNLLGSKLAILSALFERSFVVTDLTQLPENAIEQMFVLCERVAQRYTADATYYRTLMTGIGARAEPLITAIAGWQFALQTASTQGSLLPNVQVRLLAETLEISFAGTMAFWVTGAVPDARLEPQIRYAVAAILVGAVVPQAQTRVRKHMLAATRALRAAPEIGSVQEV